MDVLQREGNVFLTGAAGTGKSYLLERYLRGKPTELFPVVASTGAAAVIVGGRTFHSFFGLGILEGGADATVMRAVRSRKLIRRLQQACCVVIDEISMLSGETLHAAELVARKVRGRNEPWGGLRIIAVGDFAQLPPVATDGQPKDWAFLHPVWTESAFQPVLLSTVMRTQDLEFLTVLNFIRNGIVNDAVQIYLDAHVGTGEARDAATRLYPHRRQAEEHNRERLEELPGHPSAFLTQYVGKETFFDAARKVIPIPDTLVLKREALVMMRKNDVSGGMRFVNGSLGKVRSIADDALVIRLLSGQEIVVGMEKFSYLNGDGEEVVAAWNFPVTLAWATTIHKAQGASLDRMIVDLAQLWEPGQAYVALSRVKSGTGLVLERWSPTSIRAEPVVTAFYDGLTATALSASADEAKKYVPQPLFVPPKPRQNFDVSNRRAWTSDQRIEMIRALLKDGENLALIAEACDVTEGTVLKYIEKLVALGVAPDITHLIDDLPEVDRIRSLYEEHGLQYVKPVFDALQGKVPYAILRLVRLVLLADGKRRERSVICKGCRKEDAIYF